MYKPRPPQPNEFDRVIQFLDENLRPKSQWSIQAEYPSVISKSNLDNIRIIEEKGKILSHAVMKFLLVKTHFGLFKVAALGSVVTSESHRNQGLSHQIIERCLEDARVQGCDFAILWTNLYDFYKKMGFELAGSEISFDITENFKVKNPGLRFNEGTQVDSNAINKLYQLHTVGTLRTPKEIREHLTIPNTKMFTAWGPDNQIKSYLAIGRGEDLTNYIHEWGGYVSDLLPLISHARDVMKKDLVMISPSHCHNLIRQLEDYKCKKYEGFLGMVKLLDTRNLFFKVQRRARTLGIENLVFEKRDKDFYMGIQDNLFKTDSETDITRLLFGPYRASEIYNFDEITKEVFELMFPIPMWVWGWDSV